MMHKRSSSSINNFMNYNNNSNNNINNNDLSSHSPNINGKKAFLIKYFIAVRTDLKDSARADPGFATTGISFLVSQ